MVFGIIAGKKDILLVGVFMGLFFYLSCGLICQHAFHLAVNFLEKYCRFQEGKRDLTGKVLLFAVFASIIIFSKETQLKSKEMNSSNYEPFNLDRYLIIKVLITQSAS